MINIHSFPGCFLQKLLSQIIDGLPDGRVKQVIIGYFWTLVWVETDGGEQCGLAASMDNEEYEHAQVPAVSSAGRLHTLPARELAGLALAESLTERAVGLATINALLPRQPERWLDLNAEEVILEQGLGRRVVVVGHFSFINKLRSRIKQVDVLELKPRPGDLPASAAADVLPQADVVAITATTLINGSLEGLLALCRPDALTLLLGPTTPLSPILFQQGIQLLSGAVASPSEDLLMGVSQAGTFRQLRQMGVRLVTMQAGHDR
jgi:uncharacterized protein (DUF4213/DUF364 family)